MATTRRRTAPQTGPRAGSKPDEHAEAMDAAIVVDGVPYKLGDLTLGELSDLEDHTGLPMDAISYGSAKVIAYVVYLVRRRADPDYTLDDARGIAIRSVKGEGSTVAKVGKASEGPTTASSG